ncbi:MAG: hypothetical protein ACI4QS_09665 [Comamonas sp.]
MPQARIAEKDLLNADEMALFNLSQDAAALGTLSAAQLRDKIARSRNLRDRARTLYRKQTGRIQAVTGTKRGFSGMANERSRQKAEVLHAVVERLTQARDS